MEILIVIFWSCTLLITYTYVLYPLILLAAHRIRRPRPEAPPTKELPAVTVVVPVYNEEAVIEQKLVNLEATEYPEGRIEILFGSDSSDGTNDILARHQSARTRAVFFPQRRGKAAVLNDLVARSAGEVIVFSDANAFYAPDTIRRLAAHFVNPQVGGVCGELTLEADEGTAGGRGEGLYWRYENALKRIESDLGTTLGAVGAVYAIRKRLFRPLPSRLVADDFLIPLAVIEQGYRVEYDPEARAYEKPSNSVYGEFRRKARIGAANFMGIAAFRAVLSPRYGFAAFALWSHKIIRWVVPVLMIGAFMSSVALATSSTFFVIAVSVQAGLLVAAAIGLLLEAAGRRPGPFGIPYYFVAANAALLVGLFRSIFWRPKVTWTIVR